MSEVIGHLKEKTGYSSTFFTTERTDVEVGDYVVVGDSLLGVITNLERIRPTFGPSVGLDGDVVEGSILFLGVLEDREGRLKRVKTPPQPGAPVRRATVDDLAKAYASAQEKGQLVLGNLLGHSEMAIGLSAQAIATRHLAILAATGAGKSNTVGVLLEEFSKLKATVVVLDMHGEYYDVETDRGVAGGKRIVPYIVMEHVARDGPEALADVMGMSESQADRQRRLFLRAWDQVARSGIPSSIRDLDDFESALITAIREGGEEADRTAVVADKVSLFFRVYRDALKLRGSSVLEQVEPGKVNILDMSVIPDEALDIVAGEFLRSLFNKRRLVVKGADPFDRDLEMKAVMGPVVVVMEEAHLLVPAGKDVRSRSLNIVKRIAREGRKFGIGLVLVSQRPRNVNSDVLSQTNTKIILHLADPSDADYVGKASEGLTEDFQRQVLALDVGEALVLGMGIRTPALVKVRKCGSKIGGNDLDVVGEWERVGEVLSKVSPAALSLGLVDLSPVREKKTRPEESSLKGEKEEALSDGKGKAGGESALEEPPPLAGNLPSEDEKKEGDEGKPVRRRKLSSRGKIRRPEPGMLPF